MPFQLDFASVAANPLHAAGFAGLLVLVVNFLLKWRKAQGAPQNRWIWLNAIMAALSGAALSYYGQSSPRGIEEYIENVPPPF